MAEDSNGLKKRTCTRFCSKDNFFPEESFKSWGNYTKALCSTKSRLKDRFLARSNDDYELNEVRSRSQHDMKKSLSWSDLMLFGVGSIMGAGIFVLTGEAARNDAGPAVVLSYLVAGIAAILSVFCYTEFAVELPVAGGSFAYLRVELGDFVAFLAAGNILFEYIISGAGVARSFTSYFATLCAHEPNSFRIYASSLSEGYNHLDPIAVGISVIICVVACISIKGSSWLNKVFSSSHILVLVFILVAGFTKINPANFSNFAPYGIAGVMKASSMLFFAYIGFDGVATLGEETKNPKRDIPIGLIGSMVIIISTYCLMSGLLCLMQPYGQIDVDAPYTIAFKAVGMSWAQYVVAFGALQGMLTVLLGNLVGQARYFTHIGRTHMAPPFLAAINEKTGTPINATIVMTVANSLVGFFTDLDVLANLLSIATLLIFSLVSLALLVRRYYVTGETSSKDHKKLITFLILIVGSSIASAVYWKITGGTRFIGYAIIGPIWLLSTIGLQVFVKQARKPKMWGVPLMPWIPSVSIALNLFIMGSVDNTSFLRFLAWTGLLLVYYFFVGLHASYDGAKETTERETHIEAPPVI
ncbi:hypothetical protein ACFE04_030271 [Oxalis oulophora]